MNESCQSIPFVSSLPYLMYRTQLVGHKCPVVYNLIILLAITSQ